MYRDIVVATDAGDLGQRAAEHALGLARELGSDVHAVAIHSDAVMTRDRIRADPDAEVQDALEDIKRIGDEEGVAVTTEVREGDPCDEIVAYADERHADLIIMGTTRVGGINRLVHGSTTVCVSKRATAPVMTVGETTKPILPRTEEATFRFHCAECGSTLEIDGDTKAALEERGCILCGAEATEETFSTIESGD